MKIIVAGIDEVGRGALAGPVIAAAVILKNHISGLNDLHKQLVMLISSQIFLNLHSERNQNIKYNFKNL